MTAYDSNKNSYAESARAVQMLPSSLSPSLFAAAQQTPRTAANIILTGLLALCETAGTVRNDKLRVLR
jgi:hypothetical protein